MRERQMKRVGIREMKAGWSKYLRLAQKGIVITITDRGQDMVHVVPARSHQDEDEIHEWLSDLASRGAVRIPERWGKPPAHLPGRPVNKGRPLSEFVIEDRR